MVLPFNKLYGDPYLPEFVLLTDRLKTFANWDGGILISTYDLASAGFIYHGGLDRMQCFACGNTLHSWPIKTDPLKEHVRWLPNCQFAQLRQIRPELVEELWDNISVQSVCNLGYNDAKIARMYLQLVSDVDDKEKINSTTLLNRLMGDDDDDDGNDNDVDDDGGGGGKQITTSNATCVKPKTKCLDLQYQYANLKTIEKLQIENKQLKEKAACQLCPNEANSVILPCGHLVMCLECTMKRTECARCMIVIQGIVKVYLI